MNITTLGIQVDDMTKGQARSLFSGGYTLCEHHKSSKCIVMRSHPYIFERFFLSADIKSYQVRVWDAVGELQAVAVMSE